MLEVSTSWDTLCKVPGEMEGANQVGVGAGGIISPNRKWGREKERNQAISRARVRLPQDALENAKQSQKVTYIPFKGVLPCGVGTCKVDDHREHNESRV